ncbi:hypothetical protein FRB98_004765 [Tulasnella sp. 332]|nr:hypothetical protein FRB98_004765 [Tulasnella sp. 332]
MTNWMNPAVIMQDAAIFEKIILVMTGLYIWEIMVTLPYDWSIITGKRKFKYPMAFYFLCRYSLLLSCIGINIALNTSKALNCQALYVFNELVGNTAVATASTLLMLRTVAIWSRSPYILYPLVVLSLGQWAILLHGVIIVNASWSSVAGQCVVDGAAPIFLDLIYIYTMSFDLIVLVLSCWGLVRTSGRSDLWTLLFKDGIVYFIVAFSANCCAAVLILLNLNPAMNIIMSVPAAVASAIVACRGFVRLSTWNTREVYLPSHVQTGPGRQAMSGAVHTSNGSNTKKGPGFDMTFAKPPRIATLSGLTSPSNANPKVADGPGVHISMEAYTTHDRRQPSPYHGDEKDYELDLEEGSESDVMATPGSVTFTHSDNPHIRLPEAPSWVKEMADKLPTYQPIPPQGRSKHLQSRPRQWALLLSTLGSFSLLASWRVLSGPHAHTHHVPLHAQRVLDECATMRQMPGPSASFASRLRSERFEPGTKAQYIHNATIWTGLKDGHDVIQGDILLQNGLIWAVGQIPEDIIKQTGTGVEHINAHGAWVTPGIFDIHSHIGVDALPLLQGTDDTNSIKGLTLPWLRSMDGINVYDEALALSVSGGVTTSLILPGSADAIGGQAFVIKLRQTSEGSPSSMVLEPPFSLNNTDKPSTHPPHWRHMKHATGENPSRVYEGTRMDTMWAFRSAYEEARKVRDAQDAYCVKAESGLWNGLGPDVPKDLKWEALVDVLRGKVKLNIHSYSPSDFDGLVRLSNEFKFHISAIHHAHEAYLVMPLLEKFYGGKPAVAMFATNARYKQEAYRHSEFAPQILHEAGFDVIMKSDHPVLNSRYLLYEAVQAHMYGLPANKAIQAVTTTPARTAGFGHRLGLVQPGYDADVVLWDSHPLALGATPKQVFIDGIPQLTKPFVSEKSSHLQHAPSTPEWKTGAKEALKFKGLPPIKGKSSRKVAFINIGTIWKRTGEERALIEVVSEQANGVMVFINGSLSCESLQDATGCASSMEGDRGIHVVDLKGGCMAPGLVSFGGQLGLIEIEQEPSTNDGEVYGPFDSKFALVGDLDRAVDGLSFEGRSMLLAYRAGVTTSIAAPMGSSLISGLSVAFSNGGAHPLEHGAIVHNITALHVKVAPSGQPSVSTQIGLLRQILLSKDESKITGWFRKVAKGELPIIVHVNSADIMAKLILLKGEIEEKAGSAIKMAFFGALEAHILAPEIASADIGVVVNPARATPMSWDSQRILPGLPLSEDTVITSLLKHNVTVAIGILEGWEARNTRFELAWAALGSKVQLSKGQALALGSTNLEKIFGIPSSAVEGDWVAYRSGDMFDLGSQVVGAASERRRQVDLF